MMQSRLSLFCLAIVVLFCGTSQHAADQKIRRGVATTLITIGPKVEGALTAFAAALKDSDEEVRVSAVEGISKFGAQAAGEFAALLRLLREDPSERVRFYVILALPKIAAAGQVSLPDLIRALEDESPNVRSAAIRTLGQFGAKVKEAIPALTLRLTDSGQRQERYTGCWSGLREVRSDAAEALGLFGALAKDALPALEKLRSNESADPVTRIIAGFAITRIAPDDADAMAGFIALLDDDQPWGVDCMPLISAFEELGPKAMAATPIIVQKLNHDNYLICWSAIRAIIDVRGADAVPELAQLLKHADVLTRCDVARELGEFGEKAKSAVPALSELLWETPDEGGNSAHYDAIVALGKIGPSAKSALPRLRELSKDADSGSAVAEAVKRIVGE
jgi:HEAT repeat protein